MSVTLLECAVPVAFMSRTLLNESGGVFYIILLINLTQLL